MADKHSLNYDVRELKLGASFTTNSSQYHTIKYDFKPASVDVNKMATLDVELNNQVTVTVPHLDGAGIPQTVFKGNQRPYTKECVLIIDKVTGEITLEKLSSNITVKKTRQESSAKARPHTPVTTELTNTTQRSTSRTRVATNRRTNNAGPVNNHNRFNNSQKPSQNMVRSPTRVKTSPPQAPWSAGGNSTLASLPMIGFDDGPSRSPPAPPPHPPAHANHSNVHLNHSNLSNAHSNHSNAHSNAHAHAPAHAHANAHAPVRYPPSAPAPPAPAPVPPQQDDSSSSSSSDSDSDSGSGSDSDDNDSSAQHSLTNGITTNTLPTDVLNDDLCLSESGSDSD
ncbi:ell-associated factor Eaf [Aricia agestis]|uniref:ell-associated factor Eaf n=1 Tax=Aricia agestis TaxID=91739 RepID=UPI001C20440A|nr:ell-associated factor Eaf [Aricia agestis]XP_041988188.1 ell-associated factor Eaf [Aricia agestis]XP_041988189.1 ell-associated factor Eaf [Aricia agestis]XP_041988190.1 ell-associated factor Eaf [Aricia agestis]XP_041988191.1 ell-associated factor Eaf [Aricia agestis]